MEGGEGELPLHAVHPRARQVTVDLNVETWSNVSKFERDLATNLLGTKIKTNGMMACS